MLLLGRSIAVGTGDRDRRALPPRARRLVMNRNIAVLAFTTSVLGLFLIFEVLPGVGSFTGSVMLVVGGTVLVCQSMLWEARA